MLEAKNITVRIDSKLIVDTVSVTAKPGEIIAVCGPNGAGKSTLLRVLSGELKPSIGEVKIQGKNIEDWDTKELARARALLHQQSALTFPFRVREVVAFGRFPYPNDERQEAIVEACLERVDMLEMSERIYTTLSGGEKQRVQLARVLAQLESAEGNNKVLLLDEPTSALDLPHQDATLAVASQCAQDKGYAVAVVLHDLNLASNWADTIIFLSQGKLAAQGSPEAVITSEVIRDIYGLETHIMKHPDTGRPMVMVQRPEKQKNQNLNQAPSEGLD